LVCVVPATQLSIEFEKGVKKLKKNRKVVIEKEIEMWLNYSLTFMTYSTRIVLPTEVLNDVHGLVVKRCHKFNAINII